jgi:hypothetical protein
LPAFFRFYIDWLLIRTRLTQDRWEMIYSKAKFCRNIHESVEEEREAEQGNVISNRCCLCERCVNIAYQARKTMVLLKFFTIRSIISLHAHAGIMILSELNYTCWWLNTYNLAQSLDKRKIKIKSITSCSLPQHFPRCLDFQKYLYSSAMKIRVSINEAFKFQFSVIIFNIR